MMFLFGNNDEEASTGYESFKVTPLSTVVTDQPLAVSSSCSSSTSGSSGPTAGSDEDSSIFSAVTRTIFSDPEGSTAFTGDNEGDDENTLDSTSFFEHYYNDDNDKKSPSTSSSPSSTTTTKLSLRLDDVRQLARLGRNASIKHKCRLPGSISKADIHVMVDIDERARSRINGGLDEIVKDAIQDDLRAVYSADAKSAKLTLCIVIVVVTDGSLFRTLSDKDAVIGLVEIGLVWRLFEADDLTVYNGGLVVQTEEVATRLFDFVTLSNRGRNCLLNRLVPRVANDIMSRIADANDDLLVEI